MRECCSVKFSYSPHWACPLSLSWRLYVARILIYELIIFSFIVFIGRYAFGGSLNCLWCHVFLGGVNRHVVTWDARKTTARLCWKGKRRKWRHGFDGAKARTDYRLHLYRLAKVCKGQRLGLVYSTFTQTVVERHTLSSYRPQEWPFCTASSFWASSFREL